MAHFVLTSSEGRRDIPVGLTTVRQVAEDWSRSGVNHDWYQLEADQLDHLGFDMDRPEYAPTPISDVELPTLPTFPDDEDPRVSLRKVEDYCSVLAHSMRKIQDAIRP